MTKFFILKILWTPSFVNQIMLCFNGNTQGFLQLKGWANACWRISSVTNQVLLWTVSQICFKSLSLTWKRLGWEGREGMSHYLTHVPKPEKPLTYFTQGLGAWLGRFYLSSSENSFSGSSWQTVPARSTLSLSSHLLTFRIFHSSVSHIHSQNEYIQGMLMVNYPTWKPKFSISLFFFFFCGCFALCSVWTGPSDFLTATAELSPAPQTHKLKLHSGAAEQGYSSAAPSLIRSIWYMYFLILD